MQPGRQVPDAIALGEDGCRPVDVVTRGEQVQPRAFALGGGLQGFDDVVGQRNRLAVVAVRFPREHRFVQTGQFRIGFIRESEDSA